MIAKMCNAWEILNSNKVPSKLCVALAAAARSGSLGALAGSDGRPEVGLMGPPEIPSFPMLWSMSQLLSSRKKSDHGLSGHVQIELSECFLIL